LLANCFAKSKQLTKLDLSENNIGDAGCESLAQGLLHPQGCLVHLDLGGNKISVAGVASIASRLPEAAHLTVLGLSFNSLCHSGLRPLAEVLCISLQYALVFLVVLLGLEANG
jgi:Ran GTPase-activating protein (RanGAP) involved in mRNA processing and transport